MHSFFNAKNFGAPVPAQGTLVVVRKEEDVRKIKKKSLVQFYLHGDLVTYVTRAFDRGAVGFIANCGRTNHGVIAAKELQVPFYITSKSLRERTFYTLTDGKVVTGSVDIQKPAHISYKPLHTKTEVRINLGFPNRRLRESPLLATHADGVGFARLEFIILGIIKDLHPITYLLKYGEKKFVRELQNELRLAVHAFSGKSFWIRTDDFSPQQLKEQKGGGRYEDATGNELLSFRGVARSIDDAWCDLGSFEPSLQGVSWIGLQLSAIAQLINRFPKTRIGVFVPMVHDVSEYRRWKMLAAPILKNAEYGVMVEVPSIAGRGILPFVKEKLIDFMVIGSNDLTALTLGIDRNDERLQHLFSEEHPSVIRAMRETIRLCKKHGIVTAIGGAAASRPSLIAALYKSGIDIFSVNPDLETVMQVKSILKKLEA